MPVRNRHPGESKTTRAEAERDSFRGLTGGNTAAQQRFEDHVRFLGGASSAPGDPAVMWADLPAGRYWAARPGSIVHEG